ncbi:ABC transporter permease [Arachnia propionica]|uniref:ABC transporter permease n=1 Tax=Arachnia propionica TaxID=1750 RepID=A0A3P1TDU3_9ACTN|nr:ABC transporter permease [Arachnia propionica]MDO5082137.1 ABC transporter permease [Arachnia propionica]RRD06683.1 ABC transporter permease [Arachnia propionica]
MIKYIAKRLLISLMILFLGSLLLFVLVINSGDPLAPIRESNSPNRENLMRQMTERMGLDKPWFARYWDWLTGVLQGNFGVASDGANVNALVFSAASSTLRLVILATLLSITIGITLGVLTAVRQYSGFDYAVTMMAFVFFSLPVFWFAVLLKHYAAIEFNNWIATAKFAPPMIVGVAAFLGLVIAAVVGGPWNRRLITFGALFVAFAGVLFYFDAVTWFRRPAIGLPVYILLVIGIAVMLIVLTSGFGNKGVRNAVGVTAGVAIVGYAIMRGILMTSPSYWLLFLLLVVAIVVAVLAGQFLGGFSRRQAIFASVVTSLLASVAALIDLLLSNWSNYLKVQPRPIPTIGSATANFSTTWWGHNIDLLTHIFLPTMALMLISLASYTRYTRASMLEVLNQDYIRTARSKGISERKVITRHALRNSLIPLATIVAFDFAGLIGGAVITERVFGWQGMGWMFATGLEAVDPARVMAFYAVTGTAAVVMNMIADIAYAFLDPRISR